ncbi:alginate export family protein [Sphingobium sp. TA15]|uniref:Alginate export domain-containing protein n=1 Tax=Sphingobium indicum (strain DSM 16413 / CCM 7287 / MTCC 6362 / UT26 / NBRC 101211 / UT26S) TaxID=452662 RepID=D4Z436_SPHIU|nr:alginate export family protein [Sphingobium indicum]BAI97368.1 conserved hypothetical protein [Sphingobium indicum UT26S]BDD66785.1 alginate export family protein [Sphingobium sp. TA15]
MLRILIVAGLLTGGVASPVSAQQREAWEAPTLSITRYDEDWSDLADAGKRAHHWTGPLKHIPLGDDSWMTTGIELRARSESYQNNLWGEADAPDDSYLWLRALPYADLHVGKARAFVQPIVAYAVGVSPSASPIDQTQVDLLQGFGEVDLGAVTVRAGRQMLSLGTERLVGTRYGPNVPLAFDGARADILIGRAKLSLLAARPVQPGSGSFDDASSKTKALWGAYAALPELDIYYLGYRNRFARFGGLTGREVRHSIGLRSHGVRRDWHWNVEGVVQLGHFEGQRIAAWTLGTEIGRSFPALAFAPAATLRLNIVSGDGKAGDDEIGTFNALFPKGKYFGELSPVGPTNIINLNPRLSGTLGGGVSASFGVNAYWRTSSADGIYDIPGNLIRSAGNSKARFIGKETEATVAWQATSEWELSASLSAFTPGAFIRETGPAKTIIMLGLESNFRF